MSPPFAEDGGVPFIDRDPSQFALVLGYLRDGVLPAATPSLRREFAFYSVYWPLPADAWHRRSTVRCFDVLSPGVQTSGHPVERRQYHGNDGAAEWTWGSSGRPLSPGRRRHTVVLRLITECRNLWFGFLQPPVVLDVARGAVAAIACWDRRPPVGGRRTRRHPARHRQRPPPPPLAAPRARSGDHAGPAARTTACPKKKGRRCPHLDSGEIRVAVDGSDYGVWGCIPCPPPTPLYAGFVDLEGTVTIV